MDARGSTLHQRRATSARASGPTSLYVLPEDPRFSLCLYLPAPAAGPVGDAVLVTVHGTERDAVGTRDAFVPFAGSHGAAIVSPLFPAGIGDPDDVDNYKFLRYRELRFDELLLRMLDVARERFGLRTEAVHLVGFSGGAQFAHRFLYLHPRRLASVSIAAPGRVTLLDGERDWWAGTRGIETVFGGALDLAAIRAVPVQVVVGADDTHPDGQSRVDRARALHDSYRTAGMSTRLDIVAGAGHRLSDLVPTITDFLGDRLRNPGR